MGKLGQGGVLEENLKEIFSCGKARAPIPTAPALGGDGQGVFSKWQVY